MISFVQQLCEYTSYAFFQKDVNKLWQLWLCSSREEFRTPQASVIVFPDKPFCDLMSLPLPPVHNYMLQIFKKQNKAWNICTSSYKTELVREQSRIFLNIFRQIEPITRLATYMYILFHNLFVILDTFLQFCHWNQLFGIRLSRSVPCDNCRVGVAWKKNSLFPKKDLTWKSFPSFFKSSFFFLLCRGSSELLETHLARNLLQRFQQSAQKIWILTYLVSYIIGYILI